MFKNLSATAKTLDSRLSRGDNIFFCRYGDGDLTLIAGASREQRHKNSNALRMELFDSIKIDHENYLMAHTAGVYGDGSGAYFWVDESTGKMLDKRLQDIFNNLKIEGKEYYHALVFQYFFENDPEWIKSFVNNYIKTKKVLLIAGDVLCTDFVFDFFGVDDCIELPGVSDAYYKLNMETIKKKYMTCEVVLPVVGMASRVLAKRLWKIDNNKTLIDFGVMVDALAEAPHRGWTARMIKEGIVEAYK